MPAHDSAGVFFPGFETKDIWNGRRTSDLNKLKGLRLVNIEGGHLQDANVWKNADMLAKHWPPP